MVPFLLLLVVAALVATVSFALSRASVASRHLALEIEAAELRRTAAALVEANARLQPYAAVADAAAAVLASQRQAAEVVETAETNAQRILGDAHAAANSTAAVARQKAAALEDAAKALLLESQRRVGVIVSAAEAEAQRTRVAAVEEAKRIAGDAYALKETVDELRRTATALQNVIDGYGDRYIVPTFGLLDELAEEFGFAEAGQRLKVARTLVRSMVKDGTAATCDYVELNRKQTAIAFVLDAFNGKVDSILADVREDNYGTLAQKIRDAFEVVNHNGAAFRNARILPTYLAVRLDELRWAVVAQELKAKEREEQRALKERLRDEERAQRDFEKAQRDAAKEEDQLRKAMDKARREVERATDAEKAKYEGLLADLQARLIAAEEKNQRALSMAQQTKAGYVYVISNIGSFGENVYKIGLTRRLEPLDRVRELGDASVPFEFDVHAMIRAEDAPALEHRLHKLFVTRQVNKVNARKEFFRLPLNEIRAELDKLGVATAWTVAARCRDWKETQAIERAMQAGTFERSAWIRQQVAEIDADRADPDADLPASISGPARQAAVPALI